MTQPCRMAVAAVLAAGAVQADGRTEQEAALAAGAERLTADEIAERFTGNTARFAFAAGNRTVLVHYGADNRLAGRMVEGGDWVGEGFYGVADTNRICLSWEGLDAGRLRCLDVLVVDGEVRKYRADGSLMGTIAEVSAGRSF